MFDRILDWADQGGLTDLARSMGRFFFFLAIGCAVLAAAAALVGGWIVFWLWVADWDPDSDLFFFGVISPALLCMIAGFGAICRMFWEDFGPRGNLRRRR